MRKIDLHDPDFWSKVLPDFTSPDALFARLKDGSALESASARNTFVGTHVKNLVFDILTRREEGDVVEPYVVEKTKELLVKLSCMKQVLGHGLATLAAQWLTRIEASKEQRRRVKTVFTSPSDFGGGSKASKRGNNGRDKKRYGRYGNSGFVSHRDDSVRVVSPRTKQRRRLSRVPFAAASVQSGSLSPRSSLRPRASQDSGSSDSDSDAGGGRRRRSARNGKRRRGRYYDGDDSSDGGDWEPPTERQSDNRSLTLYSDDEDVNDREIDFNTELCALCADGGNLILCEGPCQRAFHLDCLNLPDDGNEVRRRVHSVNIALETLHPAACAHSVSSAKRRAHGSSPCAYATAFAGGLVLPRLRE